MDNLLNKVKNMKLLKEIPANELDDMIKNGVFLYAEYEINKIIHFENEGCDYLELIIEGKARVEHLNENGETLAIMDFTKGDVLGGNLIFSKEARYPMLITAKERTKMLLVDKKNLLKLLMDYPDFLLSYLEYMSDHSGILAYTIKKNINSTIREKVMQYLMAQSRLNDSDTIKLVFTKKDFAERLGVQRTSLSRELSKMKKDGLIDYDKETITILDKDTWQYKIDNI